MCLKDVLEEFILELEMQNYSPRTIKAYRNNNLLMFTFIKKEFDITELESIETVHIKACIKFCRETRGKFHILMVLSNALELSSSMQLMKSI